MKLVQSNTHDQPSTFKYFKGSLFKDLNRNRLFLLSECNGFPYLIDLQQGHGYIVGARFKRGFTFYELCKALSNARLTTVAEGTVMEVSA